MYRIISKNRHDFSCSGSPQNLCRPGKEQLDRHRKKKLKTIVWYPAERIEVPKDEISISKEHAKYPLLIVSHGSGSNANQLEWLGNYFVERGYIVASVEHRGDSGEEIDLGWLSLADFCVWERPQDLRAVLRGLLQDEDFAGHIDIDKIGAAGFSIGGYTAIALGGAVINLNELTTSSAYNQRLEALPEEIRKSIEAAIALSKENAIVKASYGRAEWSFKEPKVKGIFALSPAIGQGFTEEGFQEVDVPVYIVVGDSDVVTPKEFNAELYAKGIEGAKLTVMPGEIGHIINPLSEEEMAEKTAQINEIAFEFFESVWKEDL